MRIPWPFAGLIVLLAVGAGPLCAEIAAESPAQSVSSVRSVRQVALTFDDLPVTDGRCETARVRYVTEKLTGILHARSLPAAGLVTPAGECTTPALLAESLERWQAIGAVIGNHSATHPDFNTTSIEAYLSNIDRAQKLIDRAVRTQTRWFRAPLLHMGNEPGKKDALRAHLAKNGYRVAPVTVDNQEWVHAAVYADARARRDERLAERVSDAYIEHLAESMAYYERLSIAVFGREIPQILLLHANLLNAEHLERVVDMLAARAYAFIGLPKAVAIQPMRVKTRTLGRAVCRGFSAGRSRTA